MPNFTLRQINAVAYGLVLAISASGCSKNQGISEGATGTAGTTATATTTAGVTGAAGTTASATAGAPTGGSIARTGEAGRSPNTNVGNAAGGAGAASIAGAAAAETAGKTGGGGVGAAGSGEAGQGPTAGSGNQPQSSCAAIGFATRDGRTGDAVELSGGGNEKPVVVSSFAELANYAKDATPRVIHIDGTVGAGWSGTSGDRLEVGSNKTLIGLRPGTELRAPIHIKNAKNVIVRNLVIRGPGSNSDQAWDNLNIEGSSKNIWIDHCEFWDGQDGNADVVKGADNVSFTWNIFGYRTGGEHNFSNLVASSDDEPESEGKLNITLMFNWFTGVAQRQPRCRYGNIHVVNNLFSRDGQPSDYGISAGKDCKIRTEANHFIDIQSPIYTSHMSGSAANELFGDNIFENTQGNTTGYGTAFDPPYEYKNVLRPASEVQALLKDKVGATLENPTACEN